jgi:hypothetical protein
MSKPVISALPQEQTFQRTNSNSTYLTPRIAELEVPVDDSDTTVGLDDLWIRFLLRLRPCATVIRCNPKPIQDGVFGYRDPASSTFELRSSRALQGGILKQSGLAVYDRQLNAPVSHYSDGHFHISLHVRHPRYRGQNWYSQLPYDYLSVGGISLVSRLRRCTAKDTTGENTGH